jgi:hypothetical protein
MASSDPGAGVTVSGRSSGENVSAGESARSPGIRNRPGGSNRMA